MQEHPQEQVLVINCDNRPDRLAHMTKELARVGLPFQRVGDIHPPGGSCGFINAGARSNWYTHMLALELASKDTRHTIILEDDVRFRSIPHFYEYLKKIREFKNWEVMYFYGSRTYYIERIQGVLNNHAYMVSPESAKKLHVELDRQRQEVEAGRAHPESITFLDQFCACVLHPRMLFYGTPNLIQQDQETFGSDMGWGYKGKKVRN